MMNTNPYYIDNSYPISEKQRQLLRENNVYILTILSFFIKNQGMTNEVPLAYKKKVLSGKLFNDDQVLGLDTNHLGEKLKALFIALDKKENREKFCNSFFHLAISTITSGNENEDLNSKWIYYKELPTMPTKYKGKTSLQTAIVCYKNDKSMPVGFNIMKAIDTIIKKNENGEYEIIDTTAEQGDYLYQASCQQVRDLKSNSTFKQSFINPLIENENSDLERDL